MLTLLIFLIVLSVLVLVHEAGHFFVAKKAGMKVEEFGFGFPPRILSVKKGETRYSINLIPFGGFVKIFGESGDQPDSAQSFSHASAGARSAVIAAGVIMNLLLALLLLSVGNMIGFRTGLDEEKANPRARDLQVQILQVAPASPAHEAGLRMFDQITEIRSETERLVVNSVTDIKDVIDKNKGQQIEILVKRGVENLAFKTIPRANPPPNEGSLGIILALTGVVKYPVHQAVFEGLKNTLFVTKETVVGYAIIIKNLFISGKSGAELSGPIGIAMITGQAARLGLAYLIQLVALISINLAVLNIIPFPALDGGRLLFVLIEKIKGSPVSRKIELAVNMAGFTLLLALMFYVTAKDIVKFF